MSDTTTISIGDEFTRVIATGTIGPPGPRGETGLRGLSTTDENQEPVGLYCVKLGVVLRPGSAGDFDEYMPDSPFVMWDPTTQRWAMLYHGYDNPLTTAKIGLAWARHPEGSWVKDPANPIFTPLGDTTERQVGGAVVVYDSGVFHLFYASIALTGFETGTVKMCTATATSLTGPWTRYGGNPIISPTGDDTFWRSWKIYHPTIVQGNGRWYMFFNAARVSDGSERIGYATSDDLFNWTVDDANSPLLAPVPNTWEHSIVGDPNVFRVGDYWFMHYFGWSGLAIGYPQQHGQDGMAWTTVEEFPLNWRKHALNPLLSYGVATRFDALSAHKPMMVRHGGRLYHYYQAVEASGAGKAYIAVAVEGGPRAGDQRYVAYKDQNDYGNIPISAVGAGTITDIPNATISLVASGLPLHFEVTGHISHDTPNGRATLLLQEGSTLISKAAFDVQNSGERLLAIKDQNDYANIPISAVGAGTIVDIPSATNTVVATAGRPLLFEVTGHFSHDTAGGRVTLLLQEGSTVVARASFDVHATAANNYVPFELSGRLLTPTAGSHTYKLSIKNEGASGTASFFCDATALSKFEISELLLPDPDNYAPVVMAGRILEPSPGPHTYKLSIKNEGDGGTASFFCGSDTFSKFQIDEMVGFAQTDLI